MEQKPEIQHQKSSRNVQTSAAGFADFVGSLVSSRDPRYTEVQILAFTAGRRAEIWALQGAELWGPMWDFGFWLDLDGFDAGKQNSKSRIPAFLSRGPAELEQKPETKIQGLCR